jgi:hypothetical protein
MNRRTWLASIGTGCVGLSAGCSALFPRKQYTFTLKNGADSDHVSRIKVSERIAPAQSRSFHNDSYEIESRTESEPITLESGTPTTIRIEIVDELVRIHSWPASLDSPGDIATNAGVWFGNDLDSGQRIQVFGDR